MTNTASAIATEDGSSAGAWPWISPRLSAALEPRLAKVEEMLLAAAANADALANTASRHLALAGGKRLRPLFALIAAELGDAQRPQVLDAAVVVELTHLATLYHDDVMDSAPLRRGAPSAHAVWGNTVAILTGDLLFARASATVATLGPDAVLQQARTFERLCLGQLHETVGPREGDDPREHYLEVLSDKTASLLATAGRFGAQFAGCDPSIVEAVGRFGELVGVAFQLADDVIDLLPGASMTGKTPGTDLREHVVTMPILLLRERVSSGEDGGDDAELLAAIDGDLSDDATLEAVLARLHGHSVVSQTLDLAKDYVGRAVGELENLPQGEVRQTLERFAWAMVDRTQ
ncbi:polyprenyl synthetase family protein [Rarobacter incanus]|uniref:Heptaprenyl diphosphate synthase n=1 Tax=Rarobacter incanus TaxID=153494 RepID=A0A542SQZ1_9MICO|nr:polyprenyl synthetase family protein [Rarobacter incanus]TQK77008.1 heptaprenyl diphosphate synthase [Rarobacter incanus]